ncbi:MAG: 3'-5' exonuclease domain-containing protein 2 [Bacteroidaceae bacterium]|nr:3'-5' exonuclease domain-containing protein 2 [Bacteroidaceae bacterium]
MKKIFSKIEKEQIADLPRILFSGRVEVIVSQKNAEQAVKFLLKQPLLGFDTETRPSFKKGLLYKVSLLQVCSGDVCFLFRLNRIDLPDCLVKLLSDKKIKKIGLSWHDDLHGLLARRQFQPGTFIDLQDIAAKMGIEDMSLQKLYANILGGKIAKGQQLSNWEADSLTEAQMQYAATDAWACIQLYNEMMRLQKEGFELTQNEEMKE